MYYDICCRAEKEKQNLIVEIDVVTSDLEATRQHALTANSRADGLDGQLARLKVQVRLLRGDFCWGDFCWVMSAEVMSATVTSAVW